MTFVEVDGLTFAEVDGVPFAEVDASAESVCSRGRKEALWKVRSEPV